MKTNNTLKLNQQQTPTVLTMKTITLETFLKIPSVHCQRRLAHRVQSLKRRLATLQAPHLIVHIGIYTRDVDGYKKGDLVVIDGNGRQHIWGKFPSDVELPSHLFATVYELDSKEDAKRIYDMLDSQDAVEKTHEKITGFYKELGFEPFTTKNLLSGKIAKLLSYGCHGRSYTDALPPGHYKDYVTILADFETELFAIDGIGFQRSSVYNANIGAALLMALKKHEDSPDKLARLKIGMERLRDVDEGPSNRENGTDGITKIIKEYQTQSIFVQGFGTNSVQMPLQLDFLLYCLEKYMKNEQVKKYARPGTGSGKGSRKNKYLNYF